MSKVYSIKSTQQLPITLDEAWNFFSRPGNLNQITPANMGLTIIPGHHGDTMYAGQLIEYKLRPFLNIPFYWMTEITHVADKKYFVDEQRFGPFSLWHHQHHFETVPGGVLMTDIVHYKIPFGIFGSFAHWLFVGKKVREIFEYRKKIVSELFRT